VIIVRHNNGRNAAVVLLKNYLGKMVRQKIYNLFVRPVLKSVFAPFGHYPVGDFV